MNFLKKGGSAGRPSKVTMEALEKAVKEKTGDLVQELFANTVSAIATTGLEEKYSSKTALDELVEQIHDFVVNYKSFKEAFEANKTDVPAKPVKAPKAVQKKPEATPQLEPEPVDQTQSVQQPEDQEDLQLKEALNLFRKTLKKII